MKVKVENGRLVISLKLRKPTPSKSRKTLLVASTRGVKSSNVKVSGRRVRVNANAFIDVHRPKQPHPTND